MLAYTESYIKQCNTYINTVNGSDIYFKRAFVSDGALEFGCGVERLEP